MSFTSNEMSDLERAIAVAEASNVEVGYAVLLAAAKRSVRASRGCKMCGGHYTGAHYCPGKSPGFENYKPWTGVDINKVGG